MRRKLTKEEIHGVVHTWKADDSQLNQIILTVDHWALYMQRDDVEEADFVCKHLS